MTTRKRQECNICDVAEMGRHVFFLLSQTCFQGMICPTSSIFSVKVVLDYDIPYVDHFDMPVVRNLNLLKDVDVSQGTP